MSIIDETTDIGPEPRSRSVTAPVRGRRTHGQRIAGLTVDRKDLADSYAP
jgi:hypothetical protein